MKISVWYPTEGFSEIIDVNVEPGESHVEAIQARGDAQHEFQILDLLTPDCDEVEPYWGS